MNLKRQLKAHLKASNITASDLSRMTGIPKQSISDWLGGSSPRDITLIKKIADVFSVSLDHLFFGEGVTERLEQSPVMLVKVDKSGDEEWISGVFEGRIRLIKK